MAVWSPSQECQIGNEECFVAATVAAKLYTCDFIHAAIFENFIHVAIFEHFMQPYSGMLYMQLYSRILAIL